MRERFFAMAAGLCLFSCASVPEGRAPAQNAATFAEPLIATLPSPTAFLGWRDRPGYVFADVPLERIERVPFRCAGDELFPTHPQQLMKQYALFQYGQYDHMRLAADDEACKVPAKRRRNGRLACAMGDVAEHAIVSDLYEDRCGNFYRGYHEELFLKKNESMGTLFSYGRTSFQNPRSDFKNDMIDGHTFLVHTNELLFLAAATEAEIARARQLRDEAVRTTHAYDPSTKVFQRR